MELWNITAVEDRGRGTNGGYNANAEGMARRRPKVVNKKKFPILLDKESLLTTDQKRTALCWFLYWFPSLGRRFRRTQRRWVHYGREE